MEQVVERIDFWLKNLAGRTMFPANEITDMLLDLRLLAVEESLAHSS